jgi:uncharacterized repeat protein (TIGR01451 family)
VPLSSSIPFALDASSREKGFQIIDPFLAGKTAAASKPRFLIALVAAVGAGCVSAPVRRHRLTHGSSTVQRPADGFVNVPDLQNSSDFAVTFAGIICMAEDEYEDGPAALPTSGLLPRRTALVLQGNPMSKHHEPLLGIEAHSLDRESRRDLMVSLRDLTGQTVHCDSVYCWARIRGIGIRIVGSTVTALHYTTAAGWVQVLTYNTSSADTPDLVCTITDPTIGYNSGAQTLSTGGSFSDSKGFTIPAGASDPYKNTASASCTFANSQKVEATSQSTWTTNLFQPKVDVTKSANKAFAEPGDTVTYTVTIQNVGSKDSPALVPDATAPFTDTLVSGVTLPASCDSLSSPSTDGGNDGGSCTFTYTYTVQAGDANPLGNTASVLFHPKGFPNNKPTKAIVTTGAGLVGQDFVLIARPDGSVLQRNLDEFD